MGLLTTTLNIDCQELYRLTTPISVEDMSLVKIGTVITDRPFEKTEASV